MLRQGSAVDVVGKADTETSNAQRAVPRYDGAYTAVSRDVMAPETKLCASLATRVATGPSALATIGTTPVIAGGLVGKENETSRASKCEILNYM